MRLRYDNSLGTLGAELSQGGTTISFQTAPAFETLAAPDYIPLILEPPIGAPSPNFEVVYLTAYEEGDTTGTIERAQEGTTAVAHNGGTAWVCGPTAQEFSSYVLESLVGAANGLALLDSTGNVPANELANAVRLAPAPSGAGAITAESGQMVICTSGGAQTVTLPAHFEGQIVGVMNAGGGLVTVDGTSIQGLGLESASTFPLGAYGARAVLLDDGTNWLIIEGEQDTGWVNPANTAYVNGWANGAGGTPTQPFGYRVIGNRAQLRGSLTGGGSGTPVFAAIPPVLVPARPYALQLLGVDTSYGPSSEVDNAMLSVTNGPTFGVYFIPGGVESGFGFDNVSYLTD